MKKLALLTAIVGVSIDTPELHKEFCSKEGLKFRHALAELQKK